MMADVPTLRMEALALIDSAVSFIPIGSTQTKAPDSAVLPRLAGGEQATWAPLQRRLPTASEVDTWFGPSRAIAIVAGAVSGNLTIFDFDTKHSGQPVFEAFAALVEEHAPGLLARLPLVQSPSGGWHLYCRSSLVGRSDKLARGADGKTWIETRAEGGYCLAPLSPGYRMTRGRLTQIPTIAAEEWELLITCARAQDRFVETGGAHYRTDEKPGVLFNARMKLDDMERWLGEAGWRTVHQQHDGTRLLRRPGKERGISATLGQGGLRSFYVFSSNAAPFEANQGYSAFGVWTQLRHAGDYAAAARALAADGFGGQQARSGPRVETQRDQPAVAIVPQQAPAEEAWTVRRPTSEIIRFDPGWLCAPSLIALVEEAAERTEWPVEFFAAPLVSITGALVGGTRHLALHDKWRERACLWTAIIADAGSGKTPARTHYIMEPLLSLQRSLHHEWKQALVAYEQELGYWESQPKGNRGAKPEPPPGQRKILVSDTTLEALVDVLQENPRGVLLLRDELLGWLLSFDQYRKNGGADRQHWLSIWSGEDLILDRKSEHYSAYVHRPFVGITGGIQPEKLRDLYKGAEDGLIDRFLLFYPPSVPTRIRRVNFPPEIEAAVDHLFRRLLALQHATGPEGHAVAEAVRVPDAVLDLFSARDWHCKQIAADEDLPHALRTAYFKMASQAARVALALHQAQVADNQPVREFEIDANTMDMAWRIVECSASQLQRAFGTLAARPADQRADQALAWIARHGGSCTVRDIVRHNVCSIRRASEAAQLLEELADRHLGMLTREAVRGGERLTFTVAPEAV